MAKPAIKKCTGVFPFSGKALAFGICLFLLFLSGCGSEKSEESVAINLPAQEESTEISPSLAPSEPAEERIRITSENYLDYYEFRDEFFSLYDADGELVTRNVDRVLALRKKYTDSRISSDISVSYEVTYNARLLNGFDEGTMTFQMGEVNEPALEQWQYEMRDISAEVQSTEEILFAVRYRYWYPVLQKGYLLEGFTPRELTHYFSVIIYPEIIDVSDISGTLVLQAGSFSASGGYENSTP